MPATPRTAPRREGAEAHPAAVTPGGSTLISEGTALTLQNSVLAVSPAAKAVLVSASEPDSPRPARAHDTDGSGVLRPQQYEEAVARWIAIDQPQRDRMLQHDLDLTSGLLAAALGQVA
ncbi:hypothetical protein ACFVUH_08140 [Kitasatospora sp. NPDC058032]|uniref:hypothetical protein n=1 Tax=Kitasatospora sp. NPDC058032 TaxID=3346307 RepID=UPI0036DDE20E